MLHACFDELEKIADVRTSLLPHQQRVVDRLQREDQPGLVAIHGLGSGKTLTSIAAQEALGMPSQVVAPAALLANYKKERAKHLEGKSQRASLTSMQNMARKGTSPSSPLLIVDEAHRARDPASATYRALEGNTAEKRLLLSGSPFYNHPSDIAPLVNLAARSRVLPSSKEDFSQRYITEEKTSPPIKQHLLNIFRSSANKVRAGSKSVLNQRTAPELRGHLAKWVDYHPGSTENFPEVTREDVNVPMSDAQLRVYDTLMDKAPAWVAAKVKSGLPPNKREAQQLNAFLTAARQASNTTAPFIQEGTPDAPKIQMAFDRMKKTLNDNPNAKGVVYSNYLGAGIAPYKQRLDEAKIPYGEFTGEMPSKQRDQLVRDYNDNKIRALLLSSAGGEGLDLKGTRLLQMLEPHWNAERGHQVEGRGARYMSHAHLPEEERKLQVERYLSTRPQGRVSKWLGQVPDKSVDEYLTQMSSDKENLINQFKTLLPKEDHMLRAPRTGAATQKLSAIFDELEKLGVISDTDAQKAVDHLESLEKSKPTVGQVGRYGALGAAGGALTKAIGHAIDPGGKKLVGRALAASAVTGSVGSGAIPLVRAALDSAVEKNKIKKYLKQEGVQLPKYAQSLTPLHEGKFGKNPEASGGPPNFGPREKVSGEVEADGVPVLPFAAGEKKLRIGDILLSHKQHRGGLADKALGTIIEAAQGTPYAHASLYAGAGTIIESVAGKGVVATPLSEFENCNDFRIYRPDVTPGQKRDAAQFARAALGRGYSWHSAVKGFLSPQSRVSLKERFAARRAAGWQCGGLVASAFPRVHWGKAPENVLPVDLAASPRTKLVAIVAKDPSKLASFFEELGAILEAKERP